MLCVFVYIPSHEEPEQPSGLVAGGEGRQRAPDPQTTGGDRAGDAGERPTAGDEQSE